MLWFSSAMKSGGIISADSVFDSYFSEDDNSINITITMLRSFFELDLNDREDFWNKKNWVSKRRSQGLQGMTIIISFAGNASRRLISLPGGT